MDELMEKVFKAVCKDRVQFGGGACTNQIQSELNQAVADTDFAGGQAHVCRQKF